MQLRLPLTVIISILLVNFLTAQNVFDHNDPLIRYNAGAPLGSQQKPNPDVTGLQKWVSTPVSGISVGGGSFDVTPYKAYFIRIGNARMAFRIRFPKNYGNPAYADSTFPAMVFFHGAGEFACNSNNGYYNNEKQLVHGARFFNDKVQNGSFDGFLVYPSFNSLNNCWGAWGGPSDNTYGLVLKMVDSLVKYARLNENRVVATGLSAGGTAAWHAPSGYPQKFAASAPSAAGAPGSTKWLDMIHIPMWMATGGKDNSPSPGTGNSAYQTFLSYGGNIRYSFYPDLGHTVWNNHWNEPDFMSFLNNAHKANPLVFFQRDEFCPEDPVNTKLGITNGFHSYEWQKDGVTIATKLGNNLTIINNAPIISFTGNEITVRQLGTYRVRFKRTANANWSEWSSKPAVIKPKSVTQTPNISIVGLSSNVLPAPDGKALVPLTLPDGYAGYRWYDAATEVIVDTNKIFYAPPGTYKAKVIETYGCGTLFSPDFTVVNQAGIPKPDLVKSLTATAISATAIRLDWNQNPNASVNETGFEIYKGTAKTGPFTLVQITAADIVTWTDNNIENNSVYYYFIRAINNNGAAANSNIAQVNTMDDEIAPNPPSNLRYRGATLNSVDLSWNAATDNGVIARYDVYANGVKMFSTTNTSIAVFGLNPATYYTFYVKAIDKGNNESNPSNQVMGYTHEQGLNYTYHQGSYDNLPNFNSIPVVKSGVISNVSNGVEFRNVADNYAVQWKGFIYIPESGTYTFYTSSDDGSKLYINTEYSFGAPALVENDGLHGTQERSGNITLTRGYHSIVISYFEKTGGDVMEVRWQNTAAGITKELIPGGFYSLASVNNLPGLPQAPSGLAVNQHSYNQLRLVWNDNSNDETGFEISRSTSANGTYVQVNTVGAGITEYIDSGLNASTTYHYRVRAINNGGSSTYSNTASAQTAGAPAAPAAPNNLAAVPFSSEIINISFNDNSANETGFELWRSVGNNSNFLLLNTFPAASGGTINYSDTGLFANVVYYYRVRAKGIVNNSGYSATVNAKTLNNSPEIRSINDFSVQRQTTFVFEAKAIDPDGDVLEFSYLEALPNFITPTILDNGLIRFSISPRTFHNGFFQIQLVVDDGFEGRDTAVINFIVSQNAVPSFPAIPHMTVSEGDLFTHNIQMTDDQGFEYIQFSVTDFPEFVSTENLGDGEVRIKVNPGYDRTGEYEGYLKVDDGYGGVTFKKFLITVLEKDPNELVRVNFKYFTGNVAGWNDIKLPETPPIASPGNYFSGTNLLNHRGENTGISITPISGTFHSGQSGLVTGNNSGVFPDNIIRDHISWGFQSGNNSEDTVEMKVAGLSSDKHYNFIFFSSNSCFNCGTGESKTSFVINNSDTAKVKYFNNTTGTDTLFNIIPNTSGEVIIKMIGDGHNSYGGVLNALVIDARYDDSTTPAKPMNFTGEFIVNSGVELFWTDFAYNEYSYKVFRSNSRSGPYTNLNPAGNNKDSVFYFDSTVEPVTTYYYYVVGENNYGFGLTSDTIEIETGNNKPTITSLQDLFIKTNSSHFLEFSVDDDPVDNLNIFIVNKPSFITLENLGNNQHRINFNPGNGNMGVYDLILVVDDGKGGQASTTMKLYVMDKDTRSVFVNFGEVGFEAPIPWNNWMGARGTNSRILNLKDENGINTGINMETSGRIPAIQNFGFITGNNSGPVPDIVLQSGLMKRNNIANDGRFRIYGLNPNMRYNFYVVSSANEGTQSRMEISIGTLLDTIDSRYNSQKLGSLNNLTPSAGGELSLNMKALDIGPGEMMYVNAIIIEEYAPALAILSPIHLYAEAINKTSAKIIWTDRSWNEDQNGGMLLERSQDSLFQNVTVIALNRNVDSYIDNSIQANNKYYYRVRTKSGALHSEYSNVAKVNTPGNMVYINFNGEHPNAPDPWNNFQSNPTQLVTIGNLKAENGINTGMSAGIVIPFFGENNSGKQVGNTGFAPDLVMASNYWIDNTNLARIKLSGLSHAKKYRIGFFNSIAAPGWFYGHYSSTYTIGDRTVYLNSWDNFTKIVYIEDVKSDEAGEMILDFSTTEASPWAFYGGLIIESYDDDDMDVQNFSINPLENEQIALRSGSELNSEMASSAYPNPFVDVFNMDFNNKINADHAIVDVYDLSGRLVYSRTFENIHSGRNSLALDLSEKNLVEGTYITTLKAGGKILNVSKLIKVNK